jgi:putative transposase
MARLARVVLPDYPHHIIQRGNRRQDVFFEQADYEYYLSLLKYWCKQEDIEVWSYCLMTNHIHLIVKPSAKSDLARAIGEVHRRYTQKINKRMHWTGYLWQGRFSSYPMSDEWVLRAAAYIELNPVKAKMVNCAWDYQWSSVHAYLEGKDKNGLVKTQPMLALVEDWKAFLTGEHTGFSEELERHGRTGRPLGNDEFVEKAGDLLGRDLQKKKPGPKSKDN